MQTLLPLAVKQLINNTCQLKGVYNQACLFIYISYNIKAKSMCVSLSLSLSLWVCVCLCACVTVGEEIDIHDALADIMSFNDWVTFFANDENDFEGF